MEVLGPDLHCESDCEAVLRSLPEWFGIEESLKMYVRDSASLPTFGIRGVDRLIGFVTLRKHFTTAWEIHCIAIAASERNKGLGAELLAHAERWLISRGAEFLQVKTIAETIENEFYAQTRQFYLKRSFTPIEVFSKLWSPEVPVFQLIKRLDQYE